MNRNSNWKLTMDLNAVIRGFGGYILQNSGSSIGGKLAKKAGLHSNEGDKVATAAAAVLMVGGGVLVGLGKHILKQALPNGVVQEKEEKDGE